MDAAGPKIPAKVWPVFAAQLLAFGAILFAAAGTLRWPAAWALLALFGVAGLVLTIALGHADPALLEERMRVIGPQPEQPTWDRAVVMALVALFVLWLVAAGIDRRFGWSATPLWLQAAGAVAMIVSLWASYRVMRENSYLAPTVRVQQERGHKVVSTGAYGVVRHPFYAVLLPFFPAVGLTLGSWWCVFASVPIILLLAYRAVREERHLERDLPGYADYARKVRWRLVPGVW